MSMIFLVEEALRGLLAGKCSYAGPELALFDYFDLDSFERRTIGGSAQYGDKFDGVDSWVAKGSRHPTILSGDAFCGHTFLRVSNIQYFGMWPCLVGHVQLCASIYDLCSSYFWNGLCYSDLVQSDVACIAA